VQSLALERECFASSQLAARAGQLHGAPAAFEQGDAKLPLQRADLFGKRGLADVERLRGPRETQLLGDREEVA
jgi:hypothetical protein